MKSKSPKRREIAWLAGRCRRQLPLLTLQVICNVFYAASSVFFALLLRDVIDHATAIATSEAARMAFVSAAVWLGVLTLLQLGFRFLCRFLGDKLLLDVELSLRSYTYQVLLKKEYGKVSAYHTGDLLARMYADVSVISDGFSGILPSVAATVTRLVLAVGVMAFLEWRFTLLFVLGGAVIYAVSRLFGGTIKRLHLRVQEADAKVRSFLQESFSSLLVLKVFDAQRSAEAKASRLQKEHYNVSLKKRTIGAAAGVGVAAIFKIAYFGALVYCCLSLAGVVTPAGAAMTYGTLTAILSLVGQVQAPFGTLSGILPRFYGMCASTGRLQELEQLPEEERAACPETTAAEFYEKLVSIRFENVSFAYERDDVLRDTTLEIAKGDFCVITGLSGIGKSTLLKLLLGVYQPQEGEISFVREDGRLPIVARANGLFAYVPQGNMLFSGTIRENISFVREGATEEEILAAAEVACVTDFLAELPDGLDTVIGEKGFGLSEGQIQRIAIARALLVGAPILLLDESTSALDEKTEHKMLSALSRLENRTCIIISHKKAAYEICNREIVIADKTAYKKDITHDEN